MLNIYVLDGKRLGFVCKNGTIKSNPREVYDFRNSASKTFNSIIKKLKASNYKYGILMGMKSKSVKDFIDTKGEYYYTIANKARELGLVVIPFVPNLGKQKDRLYIMIVNIRAQSVRDFIITSNGVLIDMDSNTRYRILLPGKEANKELDILFNNIRNA